MPFENNGGDQTSFKEFEVFSFTFGAKTPVGAKNI